MAKSAHSKAHAENRRVIELPSVVMLEVECRRDLRSHAKARPGAYGFG